MLRHQHAQAAAAPPTRVDLEAARVLISERYFPITVGTLRRELARVPRVYIGRNALYETGAVLKIVEGLLRRGVQRRPAIELRADGTRA
jgi:hypothetical protein